MDTELNVQNLVKSGNVWSVMNDLASWLAQLFNHHCAPMRDAWVDKMQSKFENAMQTQPMTELIENFKSIFQVLEAMKLDIANHQIRLLRPALLSNTVEFERKYFNSLMEGIYLIDFNTNDSSINDGRKFLLKSSLMWFTSILLHCKIIKRIHYLLFHKFIVSVLNQSSVYYRVVRW